jgi:hypothetical protein
MAKRVALSASALSLSLLLSERERENKSLLTSERERENFYAPSEKCAFLLQYRHRPKFLIKLARGLSQY